jgi:ParB-like nuclease family protein
MTNILKTDDYNIFKRITGNRSINKAQVQKLYQSISENPNLAMATPIIVNDNMEVLDGQHRLEAMKKLKLPISYFLVSNMGLEEVQAINSATKIWNPVDYAISYSELGNENYKTYLDFKKRYHLSHSILLVYLTGIGRQTAGNTTPAFKKGKFLVGDIDLAHKLCKQLIEIGQYYPKYDNRSFALAFQKAATSPKYDHARMLEKLKEHSVMLKETAYIEEYMRQLEKIYNHHMGVANRVRLY